MTRQPPIFTDELDAPQAEASDAELITAVRSGDESAYATLWSRHEVAAHRLARQIGNASNADDLVSEAFLRVLRALKAGSGPDGAFRPYLFSTLRRINIDNGRSYYTRVALTDDERDLDLDVSDSAADVLVDNADSSAAWRAWNSLPDSTKTLLWHLIIEEETPAQIAPLIGTTPNGVSSRAVRAKERLRQAFLQQHLLDAETDSCRQARRRLGEYVRDALSARDRTEVRAHLETCTSCQAALFEVTDINETMKVVIGPVVLGGLVVAGHYIAASGIAAGAAKGGAFAHLLHLGHALKNPAVATATTVTVVAAGVAGAFGITAMSSTPDRPVAAIVTPAPTTESSSPAPAIVPLTPTSIPTSSTPPSTTPAASPTTPATPRATPRTTPKTTPKPTPKTTAPVIPPVITIPTTPTTTASTPTVPTVSVPAVVVTTATSLMQNTGIWFQVTGDWQIVSITGVSRMACPVGGFAGSIELCVANSDIPAGEQDYTVTLKATTANPASDGTLVWKYTDQSGTQPTQTVPIPTS